MALLRSKKEQIVKELELALASSAAVFFTDFAGAKTGAVLALKKSLKGFGATYRVVKKNLLAVALRAENRDDLWLTNYRGSVGMVYAPTTEDEVGIAKTLYRFAKAEGSKAKVKDSLQLVAGFLDGAVWDTAQVVRLSQIPSREVLQGQLVNVVSAPLAGMVQVLSGVMRQFVMTLDAVQKAKTS
jgi:large subunit ribosomal protein L10